jgi:histidyl-tRNA synthetase
MKFAIPRGTRDILPEETAVWRKITDDAIKLFDTHNFKEIITPSFELTELFTRAVGEATDIVEKEMYTFEDKGGRSLTLRPEGTASVVRSYLQHGFASKEKITKLFYRGPMFRYERPQAGRYRQFFQMGLEAIGSMSAVIDAEVISIGVALLEKLGIHDCKVSINSVGCTVCRPVIREQLRSFLQVSLPHLCDNCKSRFQKNPLRILDCKKKTCKTYFSGMPQSSEVLCGECGDHYSSLLNYLDLNNITYEQDSNLVRGLDYYTKTVFELKSDLLGAQNAICGGGRYDNLIQELGGNNTPAVGLAFGMDRVFMVLKELGLVNDVNNRLDIYVISLGEKEQQAAFELIYKLRKENLNCTMNYDEASLKSGLKEANRKKARYSIIIGEDELENKTVILKNMQNGGQETVGHKNQVKNIAKYLKDDSRNQTDSSSNA